MSNPPDHDSSRTPATGSRGAAWAPTELIGRRRREAEQGNALPVGTHLAEFEVLRVLGEGGFGIVYLAQDHSLQRRVAIKEYMPATLARRSGAIDVVVTAEKHRAVFDAGLDSFVNEARLLAQFDHPSLLKVYRFWQANGTAYMVMPFYEGVTLKDRLKQFGAPPDERWLLAMLASLTDALAVIHREHCLHRDIAPDNILMLADSGRPLLLDFGAARQVIGDATQALTAILKPGYAPVEQYAEIPSLKQGPWTDVYALCAVVYAAMMGSKPPVSVARTVADSYVPLARSAAGRYSPQFLAAIDRGLAVRPDERTASVAALRVDLGIDVADATVQLPRPAAPPRPVPATPATPTAALSGAALAPAAPKPGWRYGALAGGLLVAGALALWGLQRPKPAVAPAAAEAPAAAAVAPVPETQAPAAPPATATAPAGWTIDSEFNRVMQARQPDFTVQASAAQTRLRIGRDRLAFTITSARDGHAYVLVGGPDGSMHLMFPNSRATDNRVRADRPLTLPQASWPLDTFEPVGTEQFVVIVSEQPRDFSQISTGREDWFLKLPTGQAALAALRAHTGGGTPFAGKVRCSTPGCDAYGATRFAVDVVN